MYTSHLPQSSPDMVLRTSGEKRLSGFLMWQSAYSELVFMDIFWPEFRKIDLMRAIRTYQERRRRAGEMIEETSAGIVLFRTERSRKMFFAAALPIRTLGFCKGKDGKRGVDTPDSHQGDQGGDRNCRH